MKNALILSCMLVGAACAGCTTVPETEFYTLACRGVAPREKPLAATAVVHAYSAADAYDETQIAYRTSPYRLRYDHYRLWAGPPARLVREEFIRCLRAANLFGTVLTGGSGREADYAVEGRVVEFYELGEGGERYAVLAMEMRLLDKSGALRLAAVHEAKVKAAAAGDLSGLAEAMSGALDEAFARFVDQAAKQIK